MEQLSGADSIFLSMEGDRTTGHVGGLSILDPTDAPDFSIEKLIEMMEERMSLEPRFSMKLKRVAYGLDKPYLVHDLDFKIRDHVRRISAPAPGGLKDVAEVLGHLHAQPLDLERPLWEAWIIEGLENGRIGMYMKTHHALMDGASSSSLSTILCDLEPNPKGPFRLPPDRSTPKRVTKLSDFEVNLRAAREMIRTPRKIVGMAANLVRTSAMSAFQAWLDPEAPATSAPVLRFNGRVGKYRGFACSRVLLSDIKKVKKHFDTTLNDVVLAVSGAAMRGYLQEQGELPEEQLLAMIAISTREEGDDSLGNQVTSVPCGWATDLEDPVERLLQIHRNASKAKEFAKKYDVDMIAGMGNALPPVLADIVMTSAGDSMPVMANVLVSNVRGTPFPIYSAGAKIEATYPMSVLMDTQGLNLTVVSYMDHVDFGFTFDPATVPDPWSLAERIPGAMEELVKATEEHPAVRSRARRRNSGKAEENREATG